MFEIGKCLVFISTEVWRTGLGIELTFPHSGILEAFHGKPDMWQIDTQAEYSNFTLTTPGSCDVDCGQVITQSPLQVP